MREQVGWRVSSYSGSSGNCVEVGTVRDAVIVRDTKIREAGVLAVAPAVWGAFLSALNRA